MNTTSENVFMKLRKEINNELIRNFNSSLSQQDFSTSLPGASENGYLCFFHDWFHRILFDVVRNKLETINIY